MDEGGFLIIYLDIFSWVIFGSFWDIFGSFCLNLVYMIFNQEKQHTFVKHWFSACFEIKQS